MISLRFLLREFLGRLNLIQYIGGKSFMLAELLSRIPPHHAYCEPFGGGAALLLNKPRSEVEIFNDIDGNLVNLFRVVRDRPDAFLKRADLLLYSRELFERWTRELDQGDDVDRAIKYWYVVRSSFFGSLGRSWAFESEGRRNRPRTLWNALRCVKTIHERLRDVYIEHLDFRRCIARYDSPETFFYCDPPYLGTRLQYPVEFAERDHLDLAKLLRDARGKWLLTYNDHAKIRELYAGYRIEELTKPLYAGVCRAKKRPRWVQLIIRNYELPKAR